MPQDSANPPSPQPPAPPEWPPGHATIVTIGPTGRKVLYLAVVVAVAAATIGVMLLLSNIFTRKREAEQVVFKLVDVNETTADPAQWGKNFPRQYDAYKRTADMERTRFGGSDAVPATQPGRGPTARSKIEADPRLKTMWAGYAFAVDYRERRGHAYMLIDQRDTERVKQFKQPGACLHCHASVTVAYRKAGIEAGALGKLEDPFDTSQAREQLMKGFEKVNPMPYGDATKLVEHPVSCIDCHDPKTMYLRVTRPAFLNGIRVVAESKDPVPHLPSIERWRKGDRTTVYDPNIEATRQEMRSFVCGQCHVEYCFRGPERLLTFPWHNGLKMEQAEAHYDQPTFKDKDGNTGPFYDWKHKLTDAPALKAQHPEFELWSQGIHARSGVACADCHMPYLREGAIKISDHQVRSPLLNIAKSCQVCHRYPEEEIKARAETIQERTKALMDRSLDALMALIADLGKAKNAGVSEAQLQAARQLQRKAQWRIDYINAENSMGFHAPQETARILGEAIDFARQGQLELLRAPPTKTAGR